MISSELRKREPPNGSELILLWHSFKSKVEMAAHHEAGFILMDAGVVAPGRFHLLRPVTELNSRFRM